MGFSWWCKFSNRPIQASVSRRSGAPLELEELERRDLLSVSVPNYIIYHPTSGPFQSAAPVGFIPSQIRTAYGFDLFPANGVGQTIAIIDAFDNPKFVSSTDPNFNNSDLHQFDLQFGLPDPPLFLKLDQNGGTNYPVTQTPGTANFEGEEALDVEWAHALAPAANIILFEAVDNTDPNLIQAAVNTARNYPGVTAISMSFGRSESQDDPAQNNIFTTPAGHIGITFLAATGDTGAPGDFPAYSPNVVAVGGTSLFTDAAGNYLTETGWSGSGGGISQFEAKPAYQNFVQTPSSTQRTIPDVAFDADPNTGVTIYDSFNNGSATPWEQIGGTSFSCPAWAALIAAVDQVRVRNGLGSLDGATETLPALYRLSQNNFHDILTGNNGFPAGPGYDLVTGRGTPLFNLIVPALAGSSEGLIATGADVGGAPEVKVYSATTGALKFDFFAYDPSFHGGVRVAVGDINHDSFQDIITVTGPGTLPEVKVFDGRTGALLRDFLVNFMFDPTFTGGAYVASGDVNHDTFADLIVGADRGGASEVKVFSGQGNDTLYDFLAYPGFTGGVRVGAGDINADGFADIITGAGPGGLPEVKVFGTGPFGGQLLRDFLAYNAFFSGGIYVSSADPSFTGFADILVGVGTGGGSNVKLFDGLSTAQLLSFAAFPPGDPGAPTVAEVAPSTDTLLGGARVASTLYKGHSALVVGAGPGGGPVVKIFDALTLQVLDEFFAYDPRFRGGLFVGAA